MDHPYPSHLDPEAFRRVWQRVMPGDRPDCPFTLDPPAVPAPLSVCLGEESARELPGLERLLAFTAQARRAYRDLLRQRAGRRDLLLPALEREKARQEKRLGAAFFLISGAPCPVSPGPTSPLVPLPAALRERYRAEQLLARELSAAAEVCCDPCLARLYRELAAQDREAARRIREKLEEL